MTEKMYLFLALPMFCISCSSIKKIERHFEKQTSLRDHFTGASLYDLSSDKEILEINGDHLFTPASNVKLLTFYTILETFTDSIPEILYSKTDNTLQLKPIGGPSLLTGDRTDSIFMQLANDVASAEIIWPRDSLKRFGSGWAWDDYLYDYQVPITYFPLYRNSITISDTSNIREITPLKSSFLFAENIDTLEKRALRDEMKNSFLLPSGRKQSSVRVPMLTSRQLLKAHLIEELSAPVEFIAEEESIQADFRWDTLFIYPVDTLLSKMMKPSDNFLAEQLLLIASQISQEKNIQTFMESQKSKIFGKHERLRWVDGSGLSRYNLISPNQFIDLLVKTKQEFGYDRVKQLLPTGGEGTLEEYYLSDKPYIFAKTGTLSNNFSLSGYLETDSNKIIAFSILNNHFIEPTASIKREVEKFLIFVKEHY